MRTFLAAATGLPTLLLTAALVVVVCFWLLVALRLTTVHTFDTDVDLGAWGLGGVPVAVAFSLLTVIAWGLSVGTAVLLADLVPAGAVAGLLRLLTFAGAVLVAWRATRGLARRTRPTEGRAGAGAVVPSTGTGTAVPSTGTGTVVPSTGTETVVPSTGTGTVVPSTGTGTAVPSTGTGTAVRSTRTDTAAANTAAGSAVPPPAEPAGEPSRPTPHDHHHRAA
ncbi:hypothetical protein [Streptomyces sp. NPDC057877]|uniref:hypothetical protein n=1 Tax=Streptomyces sp. NPDC057877 TaxID=3346269 RepID=UPI0036AB9861